MRKMLIHDRTSSSLYQEKLNSGTLSKKDFWKIKKKLFPKSQPVPHAVLDKLGNELTVPQNIILAYNNEMFYRLQKRLIRANLKDYESAMNQLCRHRLHKARSTHSRVQLSSTNGCQVMSQNSLQILPVVRCW